MAVPCKTSVSAAPAVEHRAERVARDRKREPRDLLRVRQPLVLPLPPCAYPTARWDAAEGRGGDQALDAVGGSGAVTDDDARPRSREREQRRLSSTNGKAGAKPHRPTISPTMSVNNGVSLPPGSYRDPRWVRRSAIALCLRCAGEECCRGGSRESGARRLRQKTREGAVLRPLASMLEGSLERRVVAMAQMG